MVVTFMSILGDRKIVIPDTTKYLLEFVNLGNKVWSGKADFFSEDEYVQLREVHLEKMKEKCISECGFIDLDWKTDPALSELPPLPDPENIPRPVEYVLILTYLLFCVSKGKNCDDFQDHFDYLYHQFNYRTLPHYKLPMNLEHIRCLVHSCMLIRWFESFYHNQRNLHLHLKICSNCRKFFIKKRGNYCSSQCSKSSLHISKADLNNKKTLNVKFAT